MEDPLDPSTYAPGWEDRLSNVLLVFLVLVGIAWSFMFWLCNYQEPKEKRRKEEEKD